MKKLVAILLVFITLTASAQSGDSKVNVPKQPADAAPQKVDTVYVLSTSDMQFIQTLLRQNTISYNGKGLTFDELLQLIQAFSSRMTLIPKKESPKK